MTAHATEDRHGWDCRECGWIHPPSENCPPEMVD